MRVDIKGDMPITGENIKWLKLKKSLLSRHKKRTWI